MTDKTMAELKSTADCYLAKAAPTLRGALSRAAQGKHPNALKVISLSDRELVHTSYFYNDTVIEIIANHIAAMSKRYGIMANN